MPDPSLTQYFQNMFSHELVIGHCTMPNCSTSTRLAASRGIGALFAPAVLSNTAAIKRSIMPRKILHYTSTLVRVVLVRVTSALVFTQLVHETWWTNVITVVTDFCFVFVNVLVYVLERVVIVLVSTINRLNVAR